MEEEAEEITETLKGMAIRPPKLEDAGLEDCALPPHAIREAFARAAASSILCSRLYDEDDEETASDLSVGGSGVADPEVRIVCSKDEDPDSDGSVVDGEMKGQKKKGIDEARDDDEKVDAN